MSDKAYTRKEFDSEKAYKQVLGYQVLPFPAPLLKGTRASGNTTDKRDYTRDEFTADTKIGTDSTQDYPVKTYTGTYVIVPLSLGEIDSPDMYTLPFEVVVKVQAKQRVIRRYTHHLSNRGSIKEQWGMDDYVIDITGILFADEQAGGVIENNQMQAQIKELDKFTRLGLVRVECPILALFDISYMMIQGCVFPFTSPGLELVPFSMKAFSDFRQDELLANDL